MKYYDYLSKGDKPSIVVIQELEDSPEVGAFRGEVNTSIHLGFGVVGCLTSGSIRELTDAAPGFQIPAGSVCTSHAHVHVEYFGNEVSALGLAVRDNNIVHLDQHGAVVVPHSAVVELPDAMQLADETN